MELAKCAGHDRTDCPTCGTYAIISAPIRRERIITGCTAAHPERRGGQHVAMACAAVLLIDDDLGLGVWVGDERSQFKSLAKARELLDVLRDHTAEST